MTIRPAELGDIDVIANLAHGQRLRQQEREPEFWSPIHNSLQVHPIILQQMIRHDPSSTVLVACDTTGVCAFVIALERRPDTAAVSPPALWVIDDIVVRDIDRYDALARALLAATAAAAHRRKIRSLVVGCPTSDVDRHEALANAGFTLDSWFRYRRLNRHHFSAEPQADDRTIRRGPNADRPLLHGLVPTDRDPGTTIATTTATARLTKALQPSPLYRGDGPTALVDTVRSPESRSTWRLMGEVEDHARGRGDSALVVAVPHEDRSLDRVLAARSYRRTVDWWIGAVR